ncbi:tRNA dihydrouridine synthase DusB [Congregibacter litoralis]|uniref:tRNA-dihydrouridine synthase n=1 Tax=Congregibacter litoralis KT71 TaxID=314285 RepID=A4A6T4_9GAMM|nr:tRNA dihydrouridine synthase DusB [Congregibacter litoralis]EAQ98003.1 tRNA-U20-dihydrouridine synthase [Congregibacter litoralis KT71]
MLTIGPHNTANSVALAPMAGVTDLPFRRLCARFGAGLLVGEMVHSDPRLRESRKSRQRRRHDLEINPRSVQIVGNDPLLMAEAARYNVACGAQIIDINMGCPAKKVCRKAAGSALLADEPLVAAILGAVVSAVDVPVTLKIRTGADPLHRNGTSIARIAEDAGIALLAVHGRTRACAFKGEVEHDTTARIVESVDIPVLANGDIASARDAQAVLNHTGAAGVMVGRAAQGAPWLPGMIADAIEGRPSSSPDLATQYAVMREHLEELHRFYGEFAGSRIARKHIGWYLDGHPQLQAEKRAFNRLTEATDQLSFLDTLFNQIDKQDLAA